MPSVKFFGYNAGHGTGHQQGSVGPVDATAWTDAYHKIGPGANATTNGRPFAAVTKIFDTVAGYPNFPSVWSGSLSAALVAANGGVPLMPIMVFGSGAGSPSLTPPSVAAIHSFLALLPAGQKVAFQYVNEVEGGGDIPNGSTFVNNWKQISNNLDAALAQRAAETGNSSFWVRANFPMIMSSLMAYYGNPKTANNAYLPPPAYIQAYGADFYQHIGCGESVGAQSDPRFQGWLKQVKSVAGANPVLAFPEYGISVGTYSATAESQRAALLQKDYAYITGSSAPSGTSPFLVWDYWYQMDTNTNCAGNDYYCFPLTSGETEAQAIVTVQQWQTMTGSGPPPPPDTVTVTNPGTQTSTAGTTVSLQIQATDSKGLALSYAATGLPNGLSIGASSGKITGTLGASGTFTVTVTATSTSSASNSATFSWVVNPSGAVVTVTNPGPQSAITNLTPPPLQIHASDTAGYTLTYTASNLPTGLSISSSTGLITGTPTVAGTYNTGVTATDTHSNSNSATFIWTVTTSVVTVTNPGNQSSLAGALISLPIVATDSQPSTLPLSYASTTLPPGLSIDPNTGLITGTTTTTGLYGVTVTVTDGAGSAGSAVFQWNVSTGTTTVTVINPGTQTSTSGVPASLQIQASDSGGLTLTYAATGLPAGLSISPAGGQITGTPTTVSAPSVTVTATDTASSSNSVTFTWQIVAAGVTVTNPGDQTTITGETNISLQIAASDSAGYTLTYSATGLPTGLSINSGTGLITGTSSVAGSYSVSVTATDTQSNTGSAAFTWTVANVTLAAVPPGDQASNVNDQVSLLVAAVDSAGHTLTWSASGLPPGLSVASAGQGTALISGTVAGPPAIYQATVTASDATSSLTSSAVFTWIVTQVANRNLVTVAPAAGTDGYGNPFPAGIAAGASAASGKQVLIGLDGSLLYTVPRTPMPSMISSWSASGHARYAQDALGLLVLSFRELTPGTVTDGTLIWPIGALPLPLRPPGDRRVLCYADAVATGKTAALAFLTDGSVACYGIGGSATRVDLYLSLPFGW